MIFCKKCADKRRWPFAKSLMVHGRCELCGEFGENTDIPSRALPEPKQQDLNNLTGKQ